MKTRRFAMRLAMCLLTAVILAGLAGACAKEAPAPAPAPTTTAPAPAPTTTAAPKPVQLSAALGVPPGAPFYKFLVSWLDRVTELTGGRVTFVPYAAGALMPVNEYWPALQSGTADLIQIGAGDKNYQPSTYFTRLPFMGFRDMKSTTVIVNQLYDKFPEIRQEYAEFGMMFQIRAMPPDMLHTTKKAVKVPADLKALKISAGNHVAAVVAGAGGAPVTVQLTDWYTSLDSGLIDGVWDHFAVIDAFGINPLFKNHTYFIKTDDPTAGGSSIGTEAITFNWKAWNSLPKDIQDIIMSTREWYWDNVIAMDVGAVTLAYNKAKDEYGASFTYCEPADWDMWRPLAQPLYDEYLKMMQEKGKPAEAILAEAQKLIKEYKY